MRRVVVTGMGMVTPIGLDMESTWSSLLEGGAASVRSACSMRRRFRPGSRPRFADSSSPTTSMTPSAGRSIAVIPSSPSPRRGWRSTTRASRNGQASLASGFGVYLGSGEGQQDFPRFRRAREPDDRGVGRSTPVPLRGWASRSSIPSRKPSRSRELPRVISPGSSERGDRNANCLTACGCQFAGHWRSGRDHTPRGRRRHAFGGNP